MESHIGIIAKFYRAFANHDATTMEECYHPDVEFNDPVFGTLKGREVSDMWRMLLERSKGKLKIDFTGISDDGNTGGVQWIASYEFSKTGRNIVNHITANFKMRDGLIIKHTDDFDLWNWSRQAFGLKGWLMGWTSFMQHKIQAQAKKSLQVYRLNIR